jgi:hypothetical protein
MKLKCMKHDRRVIFVDNTFVHRTGDGTVCDSETARIGPTQSTPQGLASILVSFGRRYYGMNEIIGCECWSLDRRVSVEAVEGLLVVDCYPLTCLCACHRS